jgi:hypothetical protein
VAGPVTFTAQVRPDGSVESVEVPVVPPPGLDFAESVKACIATWRFEPAAAEAGTRTHLGRLRFNLAPDTEAELLALVEACAAAWNAGDTAAMTALALEPKDPRSILPQGRPRQGGEPTEALPKDRWRMELEPVLSSVQFLEAEVAVVRQRYQVRVLRGIRELDKAALAAVKRWEYTPTLLNGEAVPAIMTVTVNFRLR